VGFGKHLLMMGLLVGCGRLGFDHTPAQPDPDPDPTPDAPAVPITTVCDASPGIVCDGFESGTIGPWRSETGAGTLDVISGDAFLGGFSMRATAGNGGFAYAAMDLTPITGGSVYMRAMMRFGAGVTIAAGELVQFFRVGNEGDAGHVHVLLTDQDRAMVWPNGPQFTGVTTVPRSEWLCVELALDIGDPTGTFTLSVDGTTHTTAASSIHSETGGFDELSVGIVSTESAQSPFTVDFDEVRLGTTPIVCD
jgi:hypothetical protein